jgi:hypothetical protein
MEGLIVRTQEIKDQIEELTKQNDQLMTELSEVKKLLAQKNSGSNGNGGNGQNQYQAQNQSQGQYQNQGQNQANVSEVAKELLKVKDMITVLENKTQQYLSGQTGGNLSEKDVTKLILTMMNGMVDWMNDYISEKKQSASN